MTFNLQYKGFDYTSEYNGVFGGDDTLQALSSTGANTIATTVEFGINALDDTVYDSPTGTDAAEGQAIGEAVSNGLTVMVRPLLDFFDNGPNGKYSPYEWREYFNPGAPGSATCNAFFASYEKMILGQAQLAAANGAQLLCIGSELDQICGPAYKAYWTNIISTIRSEYPTLKLTYSATWNTDSSPWAWAGTGLSAGTGNLATQISFASELDYFGIDEYAPISNANNPTLAQLIAGWTQTPIDQGATAQTYNVTGGQSLISYYERVSALVGKPLLFTEIGYSNSSSAASDPNASTGQDDQLQANLYQAFFQAWSQSGNSSLAGALVWNWNPAPQNNTFGTISDVVNNTPAQAVIAGYFGFTVKTEAYSDSGTAPVTATAAVSGTGALAGDSGAGLSVISVNGGTLGTVLRTTYGSLTLNADGSYTYNANAALIAAASGGSQVADVITYIVGSQYGQTQTTTLTFNDTLAGYSSFTVKAETNSESGASPLTGTSAAAGTGALAGDGGAGLSVLSVSGGTLGAAFKTTYGSLTLNADGSYTYIANAALVAAAVGGAQIADVITYTVGSQYGQTQTTTLTFNDNRPGYSAFTVKAETNSDSGTGPVTGTSGLAGTGALAGDAGAGLTVLSVRGGTLGTAFKTSYGSLTLNADGSYSYYANAALLAAATGGGQVTDVITYTVGSQYGQTQTETLTFNDNREPIAVKESASVAEGQTLTGTAGSGGTGSLEGDSNPFGSALTVAALTQNGQATTQPIAGKYGTLALNGDGSYTYTPNVTEEAAGFKGDSGAALDDTFLLQVNGSPGASISSTLTIKITPAQIAPQDFEDDGRSDILFTDGQGKLYTWEVDDKTVVGGGYLGNPGPDWTYVGTGDFYGDGHSDILWRNQDGSLWLWRMNGTAIVGYGEIGNPYGTWTVVGIGDFTGNGRSDILFRDQAGDLATWDMNSFQIVGYGTIGNPGAGWNFVGTGDLDGNGLTDLLFENTSGMIGMWTLDDRTITSGAMLGLCPVGWVVKGVGDFGPNGDSSILFENPATQQVAFWNITDDSVSSCAITSSLQGAGWDVVGIGDYKASAGSSILFYNSLLNQYATRDVINDVFVGGGTVGYPGAQYSVSPILPTITPELSPIAFFQSVSGAVEGFNVANGVVSGPFQYGNLSNVLGVGDFVGDGQADILFRQSSGVYAFEETNGPSIIATGLIGYPGGTWTFKGIGDFNDGGRSDLLFEDASGNYEVLEPQGKWGTTSAKIGNPGAGWAFAGVGDFNGDGTSDVLLQQQQGSVTTYGIWEIGENQPIGGGTIGSPGSGWTLLGIGDFNGYGRSDLLFENANGNYGLWDLNGTTIVGSNLDIGNPGTNLQFSGIADIFGNHESSILFHNISTGQYSTWNMNDTTISNMSQLGSPGQGWVEKAFV